MKQSIAFILILVSGLGVFAARGADKELADVQVAAIGKTSTVLVERTQNQEYGSAFCVDARGYFITNNHVVSGGDDIKLVVNPGGKDQRVVTAKVVRKDSELDLALLKTNEPFGAKPLEFDADDNQLSEVQEVLAFGFPFGKELALNPGEYPSISVNKGRITALRKKSGKLNRIQIDAVVNPGNSGGPVLNRSGKVIGVVVSGVLGAGAVNFAIPSAHALKLLVKPEIQVHAPTLTAATATKETTVRVSVLNLMKEKLTVHLGIRNAAEERVLNPSGEEDGAYVFRFVPVVASPHLEVTAKFPFGTVTGRIADRSFEIKGKTYKLSDIRDLAKYGEDDFEISLQSFDPVRGAVRGLGTVKIDLGNVALEFDLGKVEKLTFSPPGDLSCRYTVKVRIGNTDVIEELSGEFKVEEPQPPATATTERAPSNVGALKPPQLAGDRVELKLPAPITDLAVGGRGRYLILHLGKLGKLAVFDANKGEIAKYIAVPENICFTAGLTKLVVVATDNNVIQTFNLNSFEREKSVQSPVAGVIKTICMGAGSEGPLLMCVSAGTGALDHVDYSLLDLPTNKVTPLKRRQTNMDPLVHFSSFRDTIHIRASSDGTVFGFWCTSHSPQGVGSLVLSGGEYNGYYQHSSAGHVVPGFDGAQIFTQVGIYSNELKKAKGAFGAEEGNYGKVPGFLPSSQSIYIMGTGGGRNEDGGGRRGANRETPKHSITIFAPGDSRPLVTVPDFLDFGTSREEWVKSDFTFDKRFHLLTQSNLIVSIPDTNDMLVLNKFNLMDAMKKADVDYLFVSSAAPIEAQANKKYIYKMTVESRRGGVKFSLDSGPTGMSISPAGEIQWQVGGKSDDTGVIVRIGDDSGQEIFHTFTVRVR